MSHSEKPTPRSITARPSPEEKVRFATLAAVSGLSEAALALKAIRTVLDGNDSLARTLAAAARANPPLAAQELSALKYSVAVLAGISGHLVRALRNLSPGDIRDALQRTQAAVAALEQRTHDFAKAALISWESRSD
jgi:hypothetical protein